jgi:adenylosuccinate lyase
VQKHALSAWQEGVGFRELVSGDKEISSVCSPQDLASVFSDKDLLSSVESIFERFKDDFA